MGTPTAVASLLTWTTIRGASSSKRPPACHNVDAAIGARRERWSSRNRLELTRFGGHPRSGASAPWKDVPRGEQRQEEATPSPLVHPGVQADIVARCRQGDRTV